MRKVLEVRNTSYSSTMLKILLIIIALLYILFLYMDIFDIEFFITSDDIKYMCIVLCFFISLLIGSDTLNSRDILLLRLGLFFTVIADLFLLLLPYHTIGVAVFCIAQILYSVRYDKNVCLVLKKYLIIFLSVTVIYLTVNYFIKEVELLYPITFFYAIALVSNVIRAIKVCKEKRFPYPNRYMIAYGMILFLLCDINVALYNTLLSNKITYVFMWFFYLPSQVLLALSGKKISILT